MATCFLLLLLHLGILIAQGHSAVVVDVTPVESIVLQRQNVTFLCKVGVPLQYCRVEIPGMGTFNLNNKSPPRIGVAYYGAGLSAGQCGFTIDGVDDSNNGLVKCFLGMETHSEEAMGTMHLIVAKAPKAPELDLSRGTDSLRVYKIHDTLQASCVVRDGRPVANITWYLDDEPIYGDSLGMPVIIDVAKADLQSRVQNLTRVLQPSDNGKLLKCVATHPALFGNNMASRQLDVKYPPQSMINPIDKFGYELGKPGTISLEIDANPKPQLEWIVREERIREGSIDTTGRIEAEAAEDLSRGHYRANLRIASITKQDTETQFILTAYNDMGTQDFTVLISTSPEPEGVDLGIVTWIVIVVSVMVVILIISMFIYAYRVNRWCFSGRGDLGVKNAAESSDTESAEARPKEKRRILPSLKIPKASNINIPFLKNKNKIPEEPVEIQEEVKVPLEEVRTEESPKENIVYAELDLNNQNLRPVVKTDDDKTEYAEIVYSPSEKEEQRKKEEEKKTG